MVTGSASKDQLINRLVVLSLDMYGTELGCCPSLTGTAISKEVEHG